MAQGTLANLSSSAFIRTPPLFAEWIVHHWIERIRCEKEWVSPFCSTKMQQRAHIAPPICHLVKHSAALLNLFFQHELSAKRFIETTGGSIRL